MVVIDGGYLTWTYGSNPKYQAHFNHNIVRDCLILFDSDTSARKRFWPDYKRIRQTKVETYQRDADARAAVNAFRAHLLEMPSLLIRGYDGLEADDLIALLSWRVPDLRVLGIDKDLFQLPHLQVGTLNGETVTVAKYVRHLPKTVQAAAAEAFDRDPTRVALSLALLGDEIDSVPRLIPPRQLDLYRTVITAAHPWLTAWKLFDAAFTRNLRLVLLPWPGLFPDLADITLLFMLEGCEWTKDLWGSLDPAMQDLLDRWQAEVQARTPGPLSWQSFVARAEAMAVVGPVSRSGPTRTDALPSATSPTTTSKPIALPS